MASSNAFTQLGPTVLVGTTAVQIFTPQRTSNVYRVRNISASTQYFTTGPDNTVTAIGAPSAGNPSVRTMGMAAGTVETFTGLHGWMIATAAASFEVTPGDGV